MTPSTFRKAVGRASDRYLTGPVSGLHPHLLRHACATHYYESRILVDDLSLSRSLLTIRRHHGPRVIHLDEVTASLLNLWLHERYRRWPATRNPHLYISQQTAAETGPVNIHYLWQIFKPPRHQPHHSVRYESTLGIPDSVSECPR